MTINKVGNQYFVVILSSQRSAWGASVKDAITKALAAENGNRVLGV